MRVPLEHTQGDGLLLAGLGQVGLKSGLEVVGKDTLGNIVDLYEAQQSAPCRCAQDESSAPYP